jgi:cell division septum initiation protein DivIVA
MTTPTTGDPLEPRRRRGGPVRLTPDTVRTLEFPRTPLGRRGYCQVQVERFRACVVDEIARSDAEKAELREEIDRLRDYFRQQAINSNGHANGSRPPHPESPGGDAPSVQAVNMLSQAQQAADAHIAQAQEYARRLVADARARYDYILDQAHQEAEEAAEAAARAYQARSDAHDGEREHYYEQLEARIAYLRTFAHATQVQLRSTLEALSHEVERLTEVPAEAPIEAPGSTAAGYVGHDLVVHSGR